MSKIVGLLFIQQSQQIFSTLEKKKKKKRKKEKRKKKKEKRKRKGREIWLEKFSKTLRWKS